MSKKHEPLTSVEKLNTAIDTVDGALDHLHQSAHDAFGKNGNIPDSIAHIKGTMYIHESFRRALDSLTSLQEDLIRLKDAFK